MSFGTIGAWARIGDMRHGSLRSSSSSELNLVKDIARDSYSLFFRHAKRSSKGGNASLEHTEYNYTSGRSGRGVVREKNGEQSSILTQAAHPSGHARQKTVAYVFFSLKN